MPAHTTGRRAAPLQRGRKMLLFAILIHVYKLIVYGVVPALITWEPEK